MDSFSCLLIISKDKLKGNKALEFAIKECIHKLTPKYKVDPYIAMNKEELDQQYIRFLQESEEEVGKEIFVRNYCGFDFIDEKGNAVSTANRNAIFSEYEIGGRYKGTLINRKGTYADISKISDIDWNKTINKSRYRAENNWKDASEYSKQIKWSIYGIRPEENKEDYINKNTYSIVDAVIDRDENFIEIDLPSSIDWNEKFKKRFIDNSDKEDLAIILDCSL